MVPISTDLMQQAEQVATDLGSSATNDDKDLLEVHCWDHEEIRHFNITHTHMFLRFSDVMWHLSCYMLQAQRKVRKSARATAEEVEKEPAQPSKKKKLMMRTLMLTWMQKMKEFEMNSKTLMMMMMKNQPKRKEKGLGKAKEQGKQKLKRKQKWQLLKQSQK